MPDKDIKIMKEIEKVMGKSRKGRVKIIRLVQKNNPSLGSSRIRRVYEKKGLALSKKLKRRIKNNPANPIAATLSKNIEWGIDFMSDVLYHGKKIRTLNVVDHYNRECLGISVRNSFPALRVIEYLERLIEKHGKPMKIRSDNGPEFTSKAFQKWLHDNKIIWSKIQKGKPSENAIVERFNRTYREDILDSNLLFSLDYAQEITDAWIEDYNTLRPHEALNYLTPSEYAAA